MYDVVVSKIADSCPDWAAINAPLAKAFAIAKAIANELRHSNFQYYSVLITDQDGVVIEEWTTYR